MRVLGVDPSLLRTGYGVIESRNGSLTLVEGGVLSPPRSLDIAQRLIALQRGLARVIEEHHPDVMVVEEVFSQTAFPKTALLMAHARGALVCAAAAANVAVVDYAATSVKRALVGRGGATKEQVWHMVLHTLRLRTKPKHNDITDALALAIAHLRRASAPHR